MTRKFTHAEIEAMKARIEGELKDLEEANFTYEMWLLDWRRREAERCARHEAAE
jgi:hypothetical protein